MSGSARIARLLIAARGEIAVRIAATARRLGIETIAIFSDADAGAPHVRACDRAVRVGPEAPAESYANLDAVLAAARTAGADAVHPGYGFLAENAGFAEACIAAGLRWVGPSPAAMRAVGDKSAARRLAASAGVEALPGYDGDDLSHERLTAEAARLGVPLMIKASAGGGGRGMRLVTEPEAFAGALAAARSEARLAFGDDRVLLERALIDPRHIEVQVIGDRSGRVLHLGERDCSVQRRHQKLIEEAPSPAVDAALRERLTAAAVAFARRASYENAGTVEFLLGADGEFFFIEMNARIQVEHPVTEALTGVDLVEWQLRVACGEPLPAQESVTFSGHAIEARLCAEDPRRGDLPQTGTLARWRAPHGVRVDHALESGSRISPAYDSMIAKVIASGATRDEARHRLVDALRETVALGVPTNRDALIAIVDSPEFAAGEATTGLLGRRSFAGAAPADRDDALAAALHVRAAIVRDGLGTFGGWSTTRHPGTNVDVAPDDGAGRRLAVTLARPGDEHFLVNGPGGAERRVRIMRDLDGESLRAAIGDDPEIRVEALVTPDLVTVASRDAVVALRIRVESGDGPASAASLDGTLRAPLGGRLARVPAIAARIRAGTTIAVVEAMKMEHAVTLPRDVEILTASLEPDTFVAPGAVLATYRVVED